MKNTPLVSVVIPAYNCAAFVAETLDSVLAQTFRDFEIVVVDDGSTDATPEVLRQYEGRIVMHRQPNAGLAGARNAGMRLARGELIAWLDADDLFAPDHLLVEAAYLAHNREVVALGGNFAAFDETGILDPANAAAYYSELGDSSLEAIFSRRELFDGSGVDWLPKRFDPPLAVHVGDVWRKLVFGNFMHPGTMMMRRTAVERAGWLRTDIRGSEDWQYITRIARLGPLAFIDAPLLQYRYHAGQMSIGTSGEGAAKIAAVLARTLEEHGAELADERPALLKRLAEFNAAAAYALADRQPRRALGHLVEAARLDWRGARIPFHLARILAPTRALELARRLRGRDAPVHQRHQALRDKKRES
jgi:glycosyltransferase involved in cell wall biosynthesis